MPSVTTSDKAACTTLRVVTRRNAASVPTMASPMNAKSCALTPLRTSRLLLAGLEHRGAPSLALRDAPVGPPPELLRQHPVERGLVRLDLRRLVARRWGRHLRR